MTSQFTKRTVEQQLRDDEDVQEEDDGYSDDYEDASQEGMKGDESESEKNRSTYFSVFDGQIKKQIIGSRSSSAYTSNQRDGTPGSRLARRHSTRKSSSTFSNVKSRVNSARVKERNDLANTIHVLQGKLTVLQEENRTLNGLIKRQGKELSKLYSVEGELPSLLRSHQEEIRILRVQIKKYREVARNLNFKLSDKEEQLFKMREANRHLKTLAEDNELKERDDLQSQVDDLESQLHQRDNELKDLMHNLTIKEKNHKQQMSVEKSKYKALRKEVEKLSSKNESLAETLQKKDKQLNRFNIYSLSRRNQSRTYEGSLVPVANQISASSSLLSLKLHPKESKERRSVSELPALKHELDEKKENSMDLPKTSSESSLDKSGQVDEKTTSFSAARRFFQRENKPEDTERLSSKIGLWMPSEASKEAQKERKPLETRPMFTEKPLEFTKKKDLISKLEEIDSSGSYEPSFKSGGNHSRLNSSQGSSSSLGHLEKPSASLMKELFGV